LQTDLFTENRIHMIENRLQFTKPHLGDNDAIDFFPEDDIVKKDPLILCALVIIGVIGFLYVLHCLNRNDFSPKYMGKSSFDMSQNIEAVAESATKSL